MKIEKTDPGKKPRLAAAFTLVETMVVMALVTILLGLAANGMKTTWRSQQIAASAAGLMQAFSLAQSTAIRNNAPIQVRIYKFQDGDLTTTDPQFRAWQITGVNAAAQGDQFYQISELQRFESTIVMSKFPEYSSVVSGETVLMPGDDKYSYVAIEFRPDGSTNLETNPDQPWTITLLSDWGSDDKSKLPKDARTLIISPDTGAVSLY